MLNFYFRKYVYFKYVNPYLFIAKIHKIQKLICRLLLYWIFQYLISNNNNILVEFIVKKNLIIFS